MPRNEIGTKTDKFPEGNVIDKAGRLPRAPFGKAGIPEILWGLMQAVVLQFGLKGDSCGVQASLQVFIQFSTYPFKAEQRSEARCSQLSGSSGKWHLSFVASVLKPAAIYLVQDYSVQHVIRWENLLRAAAIRPACK